MMLVPVRYKVWCSCQVQPVVRRFVAAPYDGKLEKTFVEPGDVEGLAQAIQGMAADLDRVRCLGAGGRATVEKKFNIGIAADQLTLIYRSCVEPN